ncbi:hypothetical protein ASG29_15780 [Sphingomonas sp. Leaf412]|uniref:DUF2147 domain-containing protein n=1 Tax=Sphingomonas sp. Leaf412 TaxID=1736370 RepID=UPI0006F6B679|nr:DUF2147 domain-containing protein [Sphingomonas sp. Leaf412]KQT31397.1 hypothetical protein ASG29_15780 [Sphingomonas sp. Leaf412]
MRILPFLAAVAAIATPAAASAQSIAGTWRNPGDSVRIRVAPCGPGLCGTVVAASERAKADAAAGGTPDLVGTQLLRDFRRGPDGGWEGSVFVPDVGTTVDGTLALDGRDTLVATGCLFGMLGCKAQRWTRVAAPSAKPPAKKAR